MGKKVLVLNSSPRKNGNSERLADAFIRGVEAAGHEATRFDVADMVIGGCTACDECWRDGDACIIDDDFRRLEPYLESCDVMVISAPLYWCALPAQIKGMIDRLYAYGGSGGPRPLTITEGVMLLVGGGDTDDPEYKPALQAFEIMCTFLGWVNCGVLVQGGVDKPGEIESTGALKRAEEMGRKL